MKRFLLISILFFNINLSFSQSVFEQSKIIYEKENDYKYWINHYIAMSDELNIPQENIDVLINFNSFLANPFQSGLKPIDLMKVNLIINTLYNTENEKIIKEKDHTKGIYDEEDLVMDFFNTSSSALSTTPGINFSTKLIDGTASLIAGKVKRELSISFYEKMTAKLQKEYDYHFNGNPIKISFQELLPNSSTLINTKQTFEVPAFGATWIAAFKTDLNELPFSLMSIFENDTNFMNDDLGRYAAMIFDGLDEIYNGNNVYNTIEIMSSKFDKIENHNLDYQVNLLYLIAKNTQKSSDEINKNSKTSVHTILNSKSKKYFVGLIYQDGSQMGLQQNKRFLINDENYIKYYELIKDIQFSLSKMDLISIENSKLENNTENENPNFIKYANNITDLIHSMFEFDYKLNYPDYINNNQSTFFKEDYAQKYIPVSKSITNFYNSLTNENYGGSVLASIHFLNYLSNDKDNFKIIRDLTFYGSFLADMVVASKSENANLEEILNRYAMPVTSYRMKRYYKSSIDISAYPGITAAYEFSNSNSPSFGITAPVGFSFSWRSKNVENIYAPSHSIFISALDLGAPVSYRLTDDSASGLPENIKWEQVFSPGIFYVYGFKNAPLCLSVGIQYTPLLRKIEAESIIEEQNVIKAGVSLMVDIPLFGLYKNTKNVD